MHPRESLRHSAWNFQRGKITLSHTAHDIDELQSFVVLRAAAASAGIERAGRTPGPFVP